MKKYFWLCGGYPSLESCEKNVDAYMAGGCDGIEWTIPPENPYKEQKHLQELVLKARENCSNINKHLEQISNFKQKYPNADVFPAIYEETVNEIGVDFLKEFCKENNIDTLFLIGNYKETIVNSIKQNGLKTTTSVSYYFTDVEVERAIKNTGFIYMQAFPYEKEIEAGYTTDRLKECITKLRNIGVDRPIYCAKGIRKPSDIKIISDANADGYILGSHLMEYFDDLNMLTEEVGKYPK